MAFTSAQAIIRAANFKTTVSFYQDQLGFELMILWPQPRYAVLKRDAVTLEIAEKVRAMIEQGQTPSASYTPKLCDRCSLIHLCQPKCMRLKRGTATWFQSQLNASITEQP